MRVKSWVFGLAMGSAVQAQDCSHLWVQNLEINPSTPKAMSGDTYAGYGLAGFYRKNNLKLIIKGDFLNGRFMSFESYQSMQKFAVDALYDHEMVPDAGSENPFLPGVALDTPRRSYTVEVVEKYTPTEGPNVLRLADFAQVHSIFYRAYVPTSGNLTAADLPRVFSVDARTGKPIACPEAVNTVYDPGPITLLLGFIREEKELTFKVGNFWNGTNHAVPSYVHAKSRIPHGSVSIVRFKVPSHVDTSPGTGLLSDDGDVRYWSFCSQDLKESMTLGCIPDFLAKIDAYRWVKIAIGKGAAVRDFAEANGYTFLEDRRAAHQEVMAFFLRNIFPKPGFEPYEGDYLPTGRVCTEAAFLSNACVF